MKASKQENTFMNNNNSRIVRSETVNENINSTLKDIEQSLDKLYTDVKQGFKDINNRLWANFLWLMAMIIGLAGLIALAVNWI